MLRSLLRSTRGRITAVATIAAAALGLAVPASADLLGTGSDLDKLLEHIGGSCESATEVPARLLPTAIDVSACDLRGTLVHAGSLTARIPQTAGTGTGSASVVTEDAPPGTVTELSALNTGDSILVDVVRLGERSGDGAPPRGDGAEAADERGCSTDAHAYIGTRNDGFEWRFNRGTTPGYLNDDLTEVALIRGARTIADGSNHCGLQPLTGVEQSYSGPTSERARCAGPDGQSTVDFGHRPEKTLATTCWWYSTDGGVQRVYEADIRFQDAPGTFYHVEPPACEGRYEFAGITAHEFGHAFGLAHVREDLYPHQTMSAVAPKCSNAQSSLGRGDWTGLRSLYGQ